MKTRKRQLRSLASYEYSYRLERPIFFVLDFLLLFDPSFGSISPSMLVGRRQPQLSLMTAIERNPCELRIADCDDTMTGGTYVFFFPPTPFRKVKPCACVVLGIAGSVRRPLSSLKPQASRPSHSCPFHYTCSCRGR